jgi:hypothetical protein
VLALAPHGVVAADLAAGRLRAITVLDADIPPVEIVLVRWAARPLSSAAEHLLAAARGWQPHGEMGDD